MRNRDAVSNPPLIVVGGGGHAKVLVSSLLLSGREILGFVDVNPSVVKLLSISNLGDDSAVFAHFPEQIRLVNGMGSINSAIRRREIFEKFRERGYAFEPVIHPSAIVSPEVEIDEGVQIMAGAVIQPGTRLGENAIVNTGACVDHDCWIGAHVHIAPGVTLSGDVRIGRCSHIGTGATIIQGIKIGSGCVVGAGAVVIRDVPDEVTVAGVPAILLTRRAESRP